jgi:hypothetical protein
MGSFNPMICCGKLIPHCPVALHSIKKDRRNNTRTAHVPILAAVALDGCKVRQLYNSAELGRYVEEVRPDGRTKSRPCANGPLPARPPLAENCDPADGPDLGQDGSGDCHGVSNPRINSARWRRRPVSAGPAVERSASIFSSIRGSATASGMRGRSR